MSDEPKSAWRRSWKGRAKIFAWFAALTCGVCVIALIIGLVSASVVELPSFVGGSLAFSAAIAALAMSILLLVRWLCCWRNFRRFLFGIACVVTLLALFYVEENWRGKRAWQNYRHEGEAKGQKFDRRDFIPAPVPDDQNFAMTPFLAPLYDFKPGTQEHPETNWNQPFESFKRIPNAMDVKAPEHARSNSWVRSRNDLPAWYAAILHNITSNDLATATAETPELAAKVLDTLAGANPVLEEIREASRRPHARFNIRYENDDPAGILLPHISVLKQLTLVLQLRASAELTLGRAADAVNDIDLMFYLVETVRKEPTLVSQLVRFAQLQLILQPIGQGLEARQWSDSQLRVFQQRLESFDFCADAKFAMTAERALFGGGFLDYLRQLNSRERFRLFNDIGQLPESVGMYSDWLALYAGVIPTGWYYLEQLNYDRVYQKYLSPIIDVENRRVSSRLAHQADEEISRTKSPNHAFLGHRVFSTLLLPALPSVTEKTARAQTAADLAAIACALERFRLAHGKYPPTLDALAPQFLLKLPHDIISGKPVHYRRTDDNQFGLYAVGWNEKDDGGAISWDKTRKIDWAGGDWVWQLPAH